MKCRQIFVKKIPDEYEIKISDVKKCGKQNQFCASLEKSSIVFILRNETDKNSQGVKI